MFGNKPPQAKTPAAAIGFLSGKKYQPTDKVMADDGDTSDEGDPSLGVTPGNSPDLQGTPDNTDCYTAIHDLVQQFGAQSVQDSLDQCMAEEQSEQPDVDDNGGDMGTPSAPPSKGGGSGRFPSANPMNG